MFGGRGQLSPNWPRFDNFPVPLSSNPKFGVLQQPLVSKPTVPQTDAADLLANRFN